MVMLSRAFALILLLSTGALADTTWTVDYYLRGSLSQYHTFYGPGTYDFLLAPDYITVYVIEPRGTTFGSTFLGYYGQVVLPESMPAIRFPVGTDAAVAVPVSITTTPPTVTVPELAILPRLPRLLPRFFGWGVEAKITHGLQRATTWLSAAILRAPHSATEIYLPSVTVSVVEACSGLQTLWLMLLAAGLIAAVKLARCTPVRTEGAPPADREPGFRRSFNGLAGHAIPAAFGRWLHVPPSGPVGRSEPVLILTLLLAAVLLALEANALRVALVAIGLEQTAGTLALAWKEWIQIGTTGLALAQLVGVGRLVGR